MPCTCPSEEYVQSTVEGVVICTRTIVQDAVVCPEGCTTILDEDGNAHCECVETIEPIIIKQNTPVEFSNTDYFEEASWTLTYKPKEEKWNSFFSITPDYYIGHEQYFQQGNNYGVDGGNLWNHQLGNNSFGIFNGRKEPFIVEYPILSNNTNKLLESISVEVEAKRWQNEYDFAVNRGIGFNKLQIYNNTANSGTLNLNLIESSRELKNYPKTKVDNTQDIPYTTLNGKHTLNYFYNRVNNDRNNIPLWLWDNVMMNKDINNRAISFKGKRILERLTGDWFKVRFTNDQESRYQISLNKSINSEIDFE